MSIQSLALCFLTLIFCHAGFPSANAQENTDTDLSAEIDSKRKEIHPSSLRLAARYSKHFVLTPDGSFWDMWGEKEYLKVFNRTVKRKAITKNRTAQGWTSKATVGHVWRVEDTRDAKAWAVTPAYWGRVMGGMPPLWKSLTADEILFIYINEETRDARTKKEDLRATRLLAQVDEKLFKIGIDRGRGFEAANRKASSRLDHGVFVQVDDVLVVKDGFLNGEFILWPDDTIELPAGIEGLSYRYLAIEVIHPTPEELVAAIEAGKAQMVTWLYKKNRGAFMWKRKAFPLQYRSIRPSGQDKPIKKETAPPPPPPVEITHLLVLKNGDWVEGQLISDDGVQIRFLVVAGGIAGERTYSKAEVGSVVEK